MTPEVAGAREDLDDLAGLLGKLRVSFDHIRTRGWSGDVSALPGKNVKYFERLVDTWKIQPV